MRHHDTEYQRIEALRLGDIVTLPDGRCLSLRMLAPLPANPLSLGALLVLGDLEMLLAPSSTSPAVSVMVPVESLPPGASAAKALCDGAAAFWAPHLPAAGGAMGEVLFRLLLLRNVFAPLVVIDRGGDHVFFLRIGEVDRNFLRYTRMGSSNLSDVPVERFSAVVDPVPARDLDPTEARPLPRPSRVRV